MIAGDDAGACQGGGPVKAPAVRPRCAVEKLIAAGALYGGERIPLLKIRGGLDAIKSPDIGSGSKKDFSVCLTDEAVHGRGCRVEPENGPERGERQDDSQRACLHGRPSSQEQPASARHCRRFSRWASPAITPAARKTYGAFPRIPMPRGRHFPG